MSDLAKPAYPAPTAPPDWENADDALEKLKNHLQTAVILELHTIPLYLFAAYSLKDNGLATYKILTVVRQEMLHMALSGNLLRSIGGKPRVYGADIMPRYPCEIFYDDVSLDLQPATKDNVYAFVELERPGRQPKAPKANILPGYHSIGDFYKETMAGMEILHKRIGPEMFHTDSLTKQFQTADGSWYDEDMTVISDINTAKTALNLVIEQGEGSTGEPVKNTIQSHYEVFRELYEKHTLDAWPVKENPVTSKFEGQKIQKVMLACDAAYSFLLLTIETMWDYDGPKRQELVTNNIMNLMLTVLKPLALFLVAQKLDGSNEHAAPPFNPYIFKSTASAYTELKELTDEASAAYPNAKGLKQAQNAVNDLCDLAHVS